MANIQAEPQPSFKILYKINQLGMDEVTGQTSECQHWYNPLNDNLYMYSAL